MPYFLLHQSSNPQSSYQMANPFSEALICFAVIASLLPCSSHAASDVPFIVAHKKAFLNKPKFGPERVSVTIDIYNQGSLYVSFLLLYYSISLPLVSDSISIAPFSYACSRSRFALSNSMHALKSKC